jgi:hypothetical protein
VPFIAAWLGIIEMVERHNRFLIVGKRPANGGTRAEHDERDWNKLIRLYVSTTPHQQPD